MLSEQSQIPAKLTNGYVVRLPGTRNVSQNESVSISEIRAKSKRGEQLTETERRIRRQYEQRYATGRASIYVSPDLLNEWKEAAGRQSLSQAVKDWVDQARFGNAELNESRQKQIRKLEQQVATLQTLNGSLSSDNGEMRTHMAHMEKLLTEAAHALIEKVNQ